MPLSSSDLIAIKQLVLEGVSEVTEPYFRAIAEDFQGVQKEFGNIRREFSQEFSNVHEEIGGIRHDLGMVGARVKGLEDGFGGLRNDVTTMKGQFSTMVSSLDHYLKRTEDWWQESRVFVHQHQNIMNALLTKNIITKEELYAQNPR